MKVLITGSSGFLGKYVLSEIKNNNPSLVPILLTSRQNHLYTCIDAKNYSFNNDYLLNNGCSDIECLVHMGAYTPKDSSQANDIIGCTSNIINTLTLISSNLPNLNRIIFLSSLDVYGTVCDVISEQTPCNPITLYGDSKLYCEKMISSFCDKRSITCQILRIGHVYGPGEEVYRKVIPVMIEKAIDNSPIIIYGDGHIKRTYIYAKDVARAIMKSLLLTVSNTINIVGEVSITLNDLASLIIELTHSSSEIQHTTGTPSDHDILFDPSHMKESLISDLTPIEKGLSKEIDYLKKITNI